MERHLKCGQTLSVEQQTFKSIDYNCTIALPTISMLINTGLANKLQKSCMWRLSQLTAVPRPNRQGPATHVSYSLSLSISGD